MKRLPLGKMALYLSIAAVEKRNAWIELGTGLVGFAITFPLFRKLVL